MVRRSTSRADVAVKIYGEDFATLEQIAGEMSEVLEAIPGVGLVELVDVVFCVEVPGVCAMDWASLRVEGHVVGRLGGGSGGCFPT